MTLLYELSREAATTVYGYPDILCRLARTRAAEDELGGS